MIRGGGVLRIRTGKDIDLDLFSVLSWRAPYYPLLLQPFSIPIAIKDVHGIEGLVENGEAVLLVYCSDFLRRVKKVVERKRLHATDPFETCNSVVGAVVRRIDFLPKQ